MDDNKTREEWYNKFLTSAVQTRIWNACVQSKLLDRVGIIVDGIVDPNDIEAAVGIAAMKRLEAELTILLTALDLPTVEQLKTPMQ